MVDKNDMMLAGLLTDIVESSQVLILTAAIMFIDTQLTGTAAPLDSEMF